MHKGCSTLVLEFDTPALRFLNLNGLLGISYTSIFIIEYTDKYIAM